MKFVSLRNSSFSCEISWRMAISRFPVFGCMFGWDVWRARRRRMRFLNCYDEKPLATLLRNHVRSYGLKCCAVLYPNPKNKNGPSRLNCFLCENMSSCHLAPNCRDFSLLLVPLIMWWLFSSGVAANFCHFKSEQMFPGCLRVVTRHICHIVSHWTLIFGELYTEFEVWRSKATFF